MPTVCAYLKQDPEDQTRRLCCICEWIANQGGSARSIESLVARPSLRALHVVQRIHDLHREGCRKAGIDNKTAEAEFRQIVKGLADSYCLKTNSWIDAYTGILRPDHIVDDYSTRAGNPFAASVDAVFPFSSRDSHSVGIHCFGNLAITSNFINRLKFVHLPALLSLIREYRSGNVNGRVDVHMQNGPIICSEKQVAIQSESTLEN